MLKGITLTLALNIVLGRLFHKMDDPVKNLAILNGKGNQVESRCKDVVCKTG